MLPITVNMSATGTLTRQSDMPASPSPADVAPEASDEAPVTADSAEAEPDQRGGCEPQGKSEKEEEASNWAPCGSGKNVADATSTESPEAYAAACTAGKEDLLGMQQQLQLQQQQQAKGDEVEEDKATLSCAICCKLSSGTADVSTGLCEGCMSRQQQQAGTDGVQTGSQCSKGVSAVTTGSTENILHPREGPRDAPEDSTSKATGGSRGTNSGGSGSSAGARVRWALGAGAAAAPATAAGTRKCIDEGSVRRHVVPVGPRHQVPCLPPFFLEVGGSGCCGGEPTPVLDPSLTARLVYSPSSLERVRQRRLAEGLADRAICSEGDMEAFMQQCAKNWKGNRPGWQPFSPEFAFKLLHYAGYDPAKALQLMEDPQFPFQLVCDGPVRRYDNKWRPKDRRGVISPTPYPPPVFLRGYLSRRHYRDSSGYSLR